MLAYIDQGFLSNARQLAANGFRQREFDIVHQKAPNDAGLTLESLHCVAQEAGQASSIHFGRFHLLHQLAQF